MQKAIERAEGMMRHQEVGENESRRPSLCGVRPVWEGFEANS